MEHEFIEWLRSRVGRHARLRLGIGDDAAVLSLPSEPQLEPGGEAAGNLLIASDLLAEGVHFELDSVGPRRVGHKALAVNLSDMAAMAARPRAAVVSILAPGGDGLAARGGGLELAKELYEGLLPLAERYDVALAGGDTNCWSGQLVIDVTILGQPGPAPPWQRSGARPSDAILVTGELGGSLAGRHLDFEPRVNEALAIAERWPIRAAMDISDGLSLDLSRMCAVSNCGAELELSRIPVSNAARETAAKTRRDPLEHALTDGEDFELLLAAPPEVAAEMTAADDLGVRVTEIGRFVKQGGIRGRDASGNLRELAPAGYVHGVTP